MGVFAAWSMLWVRRGQLDIFRGEQRELAERIRRIEPRVGDLDEVVALRPEIARAVELAEAELERRVASRSSDERLASYLRVRVPPGSNRRWAECLEPPTHLWIPELVRAAAAQRQDLRRLCMREETARSAAQLTDRRERLEAELRRLRVEDGDPVP